MTQVRIVPLAYNNVYLVSTAEGDVAIDAGPDYDGAWDAIAAAGTLPATVILSHGHIDHAGLAARWQRNGARVLLGAGDEPLAIGPQLLADADFDAFIGYLHDVGAPPEVEAEAAAGLAARRTWAMAAAGEGYPPAGRNTRWPSGLRYEPFVPDLTVAADQHIAGLDVLAAPGHTPGNMVALDTSEGWLFAGDQLLPDITPTPGIQFVPGGTRFQSLPAFVRSLERLRGRATRCFPGHGDPFDGVDAAIDANLAQIASRTERVLGSLQQHGPATTWDMAERLYPRAARRRFWQIIATVQGHLDLLAASIEQDPATNGYEARK